MTARALRILVLLSMLAGPCRALDVFDQLWPEVDVFVKTGESSRLFFMGASTRVRQGGYTDGQWGAHLDMYFGGIFRHVAEKRPDVARTRLLSVRVGYLFGKTPDGSPDPFVEHTPMVEATPRYYLPKRILATDRNRYDFRFVDGVYTPRYRNRLKLERTFQWGRRAITPYAHVEGFYDRRFGLHRFRFSAGGEVEVNKRFVLEGYYLRQQDSQVDPRGLNVAAIVLQIYLR